MRINVLESRELRATLYAIRDLDKTIAKMIRQHTKAIATPEWKQSLAKRADSRLQHRMLVDTATVSVSNQNVRLASAMKGRTLSGGIDPRDDWHAAEFGGNPDKESTYQGRRGSTRYSVKRHTTRQLPRRAKSGHVVYPAVAEMIPRIAALFVQTTVRTIATAFEGKRE